ncbi:hypothetical protein F511_44739 [Dorcoceras hygrometricum]|uniref:Uncharacterized protein n=1 Tax=Dorcoceras hygrometricum TaxID=472368 RepID=A0A2Z7CRY5_9LAMI|nr:hypothetical protein F511_44739 [Dorcoceras hygrometricum]
MVQQMTSKLIQLRVKIGKEETSSEQLRAESVQISLDQLGAESVQISLELFRSAQSRIGSEIKSSSDQLRAVQYIIESAQIILETQ